MNLRKSKTPVKITLNPNYNICIIKESTDGQKTWYYTENIVTDSGDLYYAQKGAGESPTNDFASASGRMELRTGSATPAKADTYQQVTTPITTSRKAIDSGYPKTNDSDTDNTGAGTDIVTWRTSWTTGDFSSNAILGGCIHVGGASPTNATKVLTHFSIASFDKTSSDTLKIFVNHTFNGT